MRTARRLSSGSHMQMVVVDGRQFVSATQRVLLPTRVIAAGCQFIYIMLVDTVSQACCKLGSDGPKVLLVIS